MTNMLKKAFEVGIKLALDESALTPEQMTAAQRLTGIGGGLAGAAGGGLLGRYLGGQAAEALDAEPGTGQTIGALLGALAGGGLGGFAGTQVPKWRYGMKQPEQAEQPQQVESALGLLPAAYEDYGYPGESMLGLEDLYGYGY